MKAVFNPGYLYKATGVSVPLRGRGFESFGMTFHDANKPDDEFPSPYGEEVLKVVYRWMHDTKDPRLVSVPLRGRGFESQVSLVELYRQMILRFPSPYGEEVLKAGGMGDRYQVLAFRFPSPYGEEVLKDFAYNSIPDRDFRGQIDTPLNFFVISSL